MSQGFTSQMARNIFYGGTMFFVLLFAALIFHTETKIPERSKAGEITEAVVRGKHLWETRNCIGCHTLLGEGAYFAPELGNVYERRGPDFIKGLDQGHAIEHTRPPPDAQLRFQRRTARRSGRVPEMDQRHRRREVAPNIEG